MKEEEKNHETTGKKTTLTDKIYQDIKDDILTKVFQPGEKLNIKELAREYQVSDTPVKQALQRLAEEKLVVNTPNKGMSVRALTPHELQDIFDMRLMMDTFFVKDIVTTLNYNFNIGKNHTFSALLGNEILKSDSESSQISGRGYPDTFDYDTTMGLIHTATTSLSANNNFSVPGRTASFF